MRKFTYNDYSNFLPVWKCQTDRLALLSPFPESICCSPWGLFLEPVSRVFCRCQSRFENPYKRILPTIYTCNSPPHLGLPAWLELRRRDDIESDEGSARWTGCPYWLWCLHALKSCWSTVYIFSECETPDRVFLSNCVTNLSLVLPSCGQKDTWCTQSWYSPPHPRRVPR